MVRLDWRRTSFSRASVYDRVAEWVKRWPLGRLCNDSVVGRQYAARCRDTGLRLIVS